jgi:hypothetical protein
MTALLVGGANVLVGGASVTVGGASVAVLGRKKVVAITFSAPEHFFSPRIDRDRLGASPWKPKS